MEISTDFLIIAVLVQLLIIAILIILIFFKLNKFSRSSSSSHSSDPPPPPALLPPSLPVDMELDKRIDKKLADMQIKLDEISTELSITKKDQNKAIANLATLLADTVNTATATATTIAVSATAPIISSELFERYSDTDSMTKSEFLELDLDSSSPSSPSSPSPVNESSTESKNIDYDHISVIDLENSNAPDDAASADAPSIVSTSTAISPPHLNLNSHIHQSVNDDGVNKNMRFSKSYQNPNQYTNDQLNHHHFNNSQHISGNMIKDQKTKDERKEEINFRTQNENQNQNPNNKLEGLPLSNEKISNPEIDGIDKEILSALHRLGEVDYTNSNNNNGLASKKNDRLNDSHT